MSVASLLRRSRGRGPPEGRSPSGAPGPELQEGDPPAPGQAGGPPACGCSGGAAAGALAVTGGSQGGGHETVHVGGRSREVGSWATYEIDRRAAEGRVRVHTAGAGVRGGGFSVAAAVTRRGGASEPPPVNYYGGRRYVGPLDAAASILRTLPGRTEPKVGGGPARDGSPAKVPYIVGAIAALDAAVARLEQAASLRSWWETNGSVSLPGAGRGPALSFLVTDVKTQGYATPEQIEAALRAAEDLVAAGAGGAPLEFDDMPAGAAAKVRTFIRETRALRAPLQAEPSVPARDRAALRALEDKCRGYAAASERCAALAAAYIEKVAAALEKSIDG